MTESLLAGLGRYIPEVVMVFTMMFLLYLESAYDKEENNKVYMYVASAIGCIVALLALGFNLKLEPTGIFTNAVVIDPFSTMVKITMVIGALGTIWLNKISDDIYADMKGEFLIMSTGVLIGAMLLASANNMLTLYLGIETLSILSFVMASFKKSDSRSSEAGLKYALYGGISSGIMLFGLSHIFGMVGSIQFHEIAVALQSINSTQEMILIPSVIFFFVGIGYKIACVPFHMWSPDVYEGSPIPVTTFFAIVPKIAGIAVLVRVTNAFFSTPGALQESWVGLLTIVSALTMTVGNVSAVQQNSVKRMLAFSSIAHAGFLLAGVVVMNDIGLKALIFYALTYVFMTLVAFYVTNAINDAFGNDHFERFNGLILKYPFMAIMMCVTLFSLAGLPPMSGFVAKFNILSALVSKKYYFLAFVAAINSVVAVYYYMRLVRLMTLKGIESDQKLSKFGFLNQLIISIITVPVVVLGIFWENIIHIAAGAKLFMAN